MTNTVSPGTGTIGMDPFVHMAFLISSPASVLALRLAMSRVTRDNSVVLDAGCGALGLLAILIRTTESMNLAIPAALVETGDRAVLSAGPDWQYGVPFKVEKR